MRGLARRVGEASDEPPHGSAAKSCADRATDDGPCADGGRIAVATSCRIEVPMRSVGEANAAESTDHGAEKSPGNADH